MEVEMNEKKIKALVGGIQKFSIEDGPGIRTTVFLKGCPLNCLWCHNPELIDPLQQIIRLPNKCIGCGVCMQACPQQAISLVSGIYEMDWSRCERCMKCTEVCYARAVDPVAEMMSVDQVMRIVLQDRDFYKHTGGGLTISGGELLTRPEFVDGLIQACEREKIDVCLDTCGYGDYEVLEKFASNSIVTTLLFDMKLIDGKKHIQYTGVDNEVILDNLKKMASDPVLKKKIIMRMPLIKGINDTPEIINATIAFLLENDLKRVTLLPYHLLGVSKTRNIGAEPEIFSPPSEERLAEITGQMKFNGIETEIFNATDRTP